MAVEERINMVMVADGDGGQVCSVAGGGESCGEVGQLSDKKKRPSLPKAAASLLELFPGFLPVVLRVTRQRLPFAPDSSRRWAGLCPRTASGDSLRLCRLASLR